MALEKDELPCYSDVVAEASIGTSWGPNRRLPRRSRAFRFMALACLAFLVYAQWRQMPSTSPTSRSQSTAHGLSVKRLEDDLLMCSKLRTKPVDPIGLGRETNARYIEGHRPTLIRNASVWTGEPAEGVTPEEARSGKRYSWVVADVLLEHGLIKQVGRDLPLHSLADDVLVYDARGRPLTSGIIDMHSHVAVHSLPTLHGNEDVSELSADITPYVRSIDGIQPTDHQIQVIKSGGVTTSLVLPGSSNNIGGEAYVIKHAVGRADGRNETSVTDLLADPDRTWRYLKMACGENAKHVHGKVGERGPLSRLGESWEFRQAFEHATKLLREQDDWCENAAIDLDSVRTYMPFELKWEALVALLRGQVQVHTHCYTVPDLEAFVDHSNEFKFPVRAFHHAHQTYLVPEILKRAWGDDPPAAALFADNMWYKAESYIGSEYAGKSLYDDGLTPIYVSDNPVLNGQHVVFEAAKAYRYGLPYHAALAAVTSAPAERLGLGQRLGKVKAGYDADIVVWDSDPLSVGASPVQIWIDGTAQYDEPIELRKPFKGLIMPNANLSDVGRDPVSISGEIVFTGLSRNLLTAHTETFGADGKTFNVAVSGGKITCIGDCDVHLSEAIAKQGVVISLTNGYLTPSFTAFGSTLGLNVVESEAATDNGADGYIFSRAVDGLALDTEKLHVSERYGVTRAISAPKFAGISTHHGTSAGFYTGATTILAPGAVFARDVALHYTLDLSAKRGADGTPTMSSAVGRLRHKLLEALESLPEKPTSGKGRYSEEHFLQKVVQGEMPLAITVHSADTIAAVLEVKAAVEEAGVEASRHDVKIQMVIVGGAEAYLLAKDLAESNVGVVLAPLQSFAVSWDQRRALTGAPLTNGTAVELLVGAGVVTAIGLEEDWLVRDLGLLAGIAHKNSQGVISEEQALDLVSRNIYKILGLEELEVEKHFLIHEGNPLEIDSKVKAISSANGVVHVF